MRSIIISLKTCHVCFTNCVIYVLAGPVDCHIDPIAANASRLHTSNSTIPLLDTQTTLASTEITITPGLTPHVTTFTSLDSADIPVESLLFPTVSISTTQVETPPTLFSVSVTQPGEEEDVEAMAPTTPPPSLSTAQEGLSCI